MTTFQKNTKKYENLILYIANKLGGEIRGKKKLAKLLYFVDFDFFEKNEKSITDDKYNALPMGPFPMRLSAVIDGLEKTKKISVERQKEWGVGYEPTEVFTALEESNMEVFSDEEIKMINRVIKNYGGLTGTQLEKLSHDEAPYTGTPPNEEIDYELAYYRQTEFSDI